MGEIGGMDLAALMYLGEVGLAIGDAEGCPDHPGRARLLRPRLS